MQVEISNQEKLEKAIEQMKADSPENLHILADFDRTLTKSFVDGKLVPSMMSILRDGKYLTPDFSTRSYALYDQYYPIETDHTIPKEIKKKEMDDWWRKSFSLLLECGLNKTEVDKALNSGKIVFREGLLEFVDLLHNHGVPMVIMSASALGGEAIEICLKKEKHWFDNTYVISNNFIWDDQGKAVGIKEPIVHALNKAETAIADYPVYEKVKNRKNVILLGDNPADVDMVEGFDYDNLIKIGFLNDHIEKNLDAYKEHYDAVILSDGPFDFINNLTKHILS